MKIDDTQPKKLFAIVFFLSCVGCKQHKSVSERIATQIRSGATKIDVGRLAGFDWNRLFVFAPYAYPKGMCETIRPLPAECSAAHFSDVDEGQFLLVFMNGHNVARRPAFTSCVADNRGNNRNYSAPG
jgi:hypothetical protein